MSDQHEKFTQRLKSSSPAVFTVAFWLHARGNTVTIPAVRVAPTAAEADDYVDSGDIFVIDPANDKRRVLEVKWSSRNFTSRDDWPLPEMFISNKRAVDRHNGNVYAYVIVSKDRQAMAVVKSETSDLWYVTAKRASNTGNVEQVYACAVGVAKFYKLAI